MIKKKCRQKLVLEHAWQDESRIHFSFSVEIDDGCKIERTYVADVVIPIMEAVLKTSEFDRNVSLILPDNKLTMLKGYEFDRNVSLILPDNKLTMLKGYEFYSKKENDNITIDNGFYYAREIIKEYPPVKMTVEDIEKN